MQSAQFQAERLLTLRTRRSAAYKGLYALQMKQGSRNFARKDGPREVFFVRLNNSTEEMSGQALLDYRQKHWPE